MQCDERTVKEAWYIYLNKNTIRNTAKHFGVSKSTVHNDLQNRLPKINSKLYKKVCDVLKFNFSIKHIRGGEVVKRKAQARLKNLKNSALN